LAPPVLLRLVRALGTAGRQADALAAAETLTDIEPSAASWNELARLRIQQGDAAAAKASLERAQEVEPGNAGSLEWLGLLALQQGHVAEAASLLAESVKKDPARANAWNLLAVARFQPDLTAGELTKGFKIPRGSALRSQLGKNEQTACEYRTAHDVDLWPIELVQAEYFTRDLTNIELPNVPGVRTIVHSPSPM